MRPSSLFGATGVGPGATVHPAARLERGVTVDPGVGDRAGGGDRRRHRDRRQRGDRPGRAHRPQLLDRRRRDPHARADRRPRDHPSGLPDRPGRFRLPARPQGPDQGAADRPGHHPGRRRDRRQHHDRPRRQPRHRDRRGHQDRQSGPDRPQLLDRPPLLHRRADRHFGQRRRSGTTLCWAARSGSPTTSRSASGARLGARSGVITDVPAGVQWGGFPARPFRDWLKAEVAACAPGAADRAARQGERTAGGRRHDRGHARRRRHPQAARGAAAPLSVPDGRPHRADPRRRVRRSASRT